MSRLRYLSDDDIGRVVEALTRDLFPGTPAFQTAGEEGRQRLLSALGQARLPYYRSLQVKAAVLHHRINKGHPLVDGNKRLALTAMLTFLLINDAVLVASDNELELFALSVANDTLTQEEAVNFVRTRTIRLDWEGDRLERWFAALSPSERIGHLAFLRANPELSAAFVGLLRQRGLLD